MVRAGQELADAGVDMRVTWHALDWREFREELYRNVGSGSGRYDLCMIDHPWVGDLS